MVMRWGRATPVARYLMIKRSAGLWPAHDPSGPEARAPEDHDAPLEWRAPST